MFKTDESRIAINTLSYKSETITLTSNKIVLPSLYRYLSAFLLRDKRDKLSLIEVEKISIHVEKSASSEKKPQEVSSPPPAEMIQRFRDIYSDIFKLIPPLSVKTVNLSTSTFELNVSECELKDENLGAILESNLFPGPIALQAKLGPDTDWTLNASINTLELIIDARMAETLSGYLLSGQVRQAGEVLELTSELVMGEYLPKSFRAHSSGFTLSDTLLSLWPKWNRGSLKLESVQIDWNSGAYTGLFQLSSNDSQVHNLEIPLNVNFGIEGDLTTVTIQSLELHSTWAEASLSHPVTLQYKNGIRLLNPTQDARLDILIDLSKQSLIDAEGRLETHVWIPNDSNLEDVVLNFEMSGEALTYADHSVQSFQVAGSLKRSAVILESALIRPDLAKESLVSLNGKLDILARTLELNYEILLAGDLVNNFTQTSFFSDQLWITGLIKGPLAGPDITYNILEATLKLPEMNAVGLLGGGSVKNLAEFSWDGFVESDGAFVISEIAGQINKGAIHLELLSLALSDPQLFELVLKEPVSVDFDLDDKNILNSLLVSTFELSSKEEKISCAYSAELGLYLEVSNFSFARLNHWVCNPMPACELESLSAHIDPSDDFLEGELSFQASLPLPNDIDAMASFQGKFDDTGVSVDTLQLTAEGSNVVQCSLALPLGIASPSTNKASFLEFWNEDNVHGELHIRLEPAVVDLIRDKTGIAMASGELELHVSGDLFRPQTQLEVNARGLGLGDLFTDGISPKIDSIQLQAITNPEHLEISNLQLSFNESSLEGSAALPLNILTAWLRSDSKEIRTLLNALTGELTLTHWKMEDWMELMPAGLLRRSGSLNGSLKVNEGLNLKGFLHFDDFGLRPTESFSSIDRISGDLLLENRHFNLRSVSAHVGDNAINATGWVNMQSIRDILWDIHISGENIPVLRTSDMILRSDIDLEAKRLNKDDIPLVQGRLDLQSSTLLIEFDPLASSTELGPGIKPPFFSIEQEPVKNWLFDITIFGETFMRVRSPYFRTQLSANFHLGGSFQEPELFGNIQTSSGEILFPGMKMRIDKGEVFIESSSLDTVQLNFTGTGQSASHVVTMEVSNTIDDPYIQFQSSPELPNTSIARLLATGTTGRGNVSSVGLYLGKGFLGAGSVNETLMDRLTIDFGKERSRSGRQTFSALFELDKDWSLSGEYNQYDAYNMNLIWHLFRQ